jgi:single-stranded DNA-binding protein
MSQTINQIIISLRSAEDPRTIKEDNGKVTFASVFAIHNAVRQGKTEALPIVVRATRDLARLLVDSLTKGTAFIVEGQLCYYKHPDTGRERYSIFAEKVTSITPPRNKPANPESDTESDYE